MTSTAAMVNELESTKATLADRFATSLRATALKIANHRGFVAEAEDERDRLLRESATVLTRSEAAGFAGVSVSRVDQIRGGAA